MQNNSTAFQDAVARAKQIAQKLSAAAPNAAGLGATLKRSNNDDDPSNKRPALSTSAIETASPVLRAQLIAQQINSQLGVKPSGDSLPLSNQLTFQEDYPIPDKFVGLIIGKGGEQITRLQAESGCKVQISPLRQDSSSGGPNPPDRIANLSGSREAIDRARKIMDDIISRGRMAEVGANPYSMGSSKGIEVLLPSAKCGLIIGKGGENIRRIMDEYSVKLFVGQETIDIDGIEHKPLKISGDPEKAERARQHVLDQLSRPGPNSAAARAAAAAAAAGNQTTGSTYNDYGSRNDGVPGAGPCNEAVFHVPYDKAGIIIGKGGETIKEINRKSGAFVELDKNYVSPPGTPPERVFKLRGTPEQIVTAQQLMYERVANSACGASDLLTPILFQTQFNLPLVGNTPIDGGWNASSGTDPAAAAAADPYSQWAAAYAQWPQAAAGANGANPTDPSAAMMDPAWLAYYQSMNYYSMMQSNMSSTTSTASTTTTKPTDSTADSTTAAAPATTNATSSTTTTSATAASGQPDYTQQWIEYYRSVGQNEYADQIAQQVKDGSASAWAAYAQQWSNGAASTTTAASGSTSTSNGNSTSS